MKLGKDEDDCSSDEGKEGFEAQIPLIEDFVSHVIHENREV